MELGERVLYLDDPPLGGDDVASWQRIISTHPILGTPRLQVNGVFDDLTDTITRRWQAEHSLSVDGIVGPVVLSTARHVTEKEGDPRPLPARSDVEDVLAYRQAALEERVARLQDVESARP